MPEGRDIEPGIDELERRLHQIIELLPAVIQQAYHALNHFPPAIDREDDAHRIVLLLIDRDHRMLKSYECASSLRTWLFTITRRQVANRLWRQRRYVELDVVSDALVETSGQELRVLTKEREALVKSALSGLSAHEQYLFQLLCDGRDAREIAIALKVTMKSYYTEKSALIKKLRNIFHGL